MKPNRKKRRKVEAVIFFTCVIAVICALAFRAAHGEGQSIRVFSVCDTDTGHLDGVIVSTDRAGHWSIPIPPDVCTSTTPMVPDQQPAKPKATI